MITSLPTLDALESPGWEGFSNTSKISLTPWMIISLPSFPKKRPLSRWISYAGPSVAPWPGSTLSHRTDLSQASNAPAWVSFNSGRGIEMVEMVWHSQTLAGR